MSQEWIAIAEPAVSVMAAVETPGLPADRLRAMETAYVELRRTARAAGLLERRHGYYLWRGGVSFALLLGSLALALTAPPTVGWIVLASALIGFGSVQVGLIGHDAGHRAVFADKRANWALGSLCWSLSLGIGFWYWTDRHNRHHAHTNDAGADPEFAGGGLITFTEEEAAARRGWRRTMARHQAALSPFLLIFMLLLAFYFRVESWIYALRQLRGGRRRLEVTLMALNLLLWAAPVMALGWRWLLIFIGGQALGGLYLALVVAPNHKGMPVWARGVPLSFLERQVLSSRNVTAHPVWDFLYGGLNYQIEHHLFPTMPRANFGRVQALVRSCCARHGLSYEELDPLPAYWAVVSELRRVGRAAGDV